jgi:hypothetical protein
VTPRDFTIFIFEEPFGQRDSGGTASSDCPPAR